MDKKSLFDMFKKMADEMMSGSEKLFQKVAEKLHDESQVHGEVLNLHHSVQTILKNYKGDLDFKVKESVEHFLSELKAILEMDSELSTSKYPIEQLALTEKCIKIICSAKPELESIPDLWNPIKGNIIIFIEKITEIENIFDKEEAEFSAEKEFNDYKKSISDLKSKLSDIISI